MSANSSAPLACFSVPASLSSTSWWRRTIGADATAGLVGAAVLASVATIEVMRACVSAAGPGALADHVVSGIIVALFAAGTYRFARRSRAVSGVTVASAFALAAHGGTLVLQGETVGALFLGLAPIVAMLSHVAFAPPASVLRDPYAGAKMVELWEKPSSRRQTAPAAQPAASRTPLAMRASQATIIDALVTTQNDSCNGPITLRSCALSA